VRQPLAMTLPSTPLTLTSLAGCPQKWAYQEGIGLRRRQAGPGHSQQIE
jgi:hypothetical protein